MWVDHEVREQLLNKPTLAQMKNSAAVLRLDAQVQWKRDHAKTISDKIVTMYWRVCHVTTPLTAFRYIKDQRETTWHFWRWRSVARCILWLLSRYRPALQIGTISPYVPTPYYSVWSLWWIFHHTLCHRQIPSVAFVETEITRRIAN